LTGKLQCGNILSNENTRDHADGLELAALAHGTASPPWLNPRTIATQIRAIGGKPMALFFLEND
jgi:hypothetical protein